MKTEDITPAVLNRVKNGDEKALLFIYKKYSSPLFQFIHRQVRDVYSSEELVQDVFLGCIDGIREGREIVSFSAYIYTIARYKTIDFIRRKKIKKVFFSALPEQIVNGCAALLFNEKVHREEVADIIEGVLNCLPHEYALIIRLKYIDGLTVKKIACKLTVSFKAAESMLFRARRAFSHRYYDLTV